MSVDREERFPTSGQFGRALSSGNLSTPADAPTMPPSGIGAARNAEAAGPVAEGTVVARAKPVAVSDSLRSAESNRTTEGKPDLPNSNRSEIQSVSEQLRTATPMAQQEVERQAHFDIQPPAFLRSRSDAAQTTIQQQAERSQALAVEQLRALVNGLATAAPAPAARPAVGDSR